MEKLENIVGQLFQQIAIKEKIEQKRIFLATSTCSDETNNNEELFHITGTVFHLGGLAGFPHAGVTGINAFLDHVPDKGAAVILYGPHIGKGEDGKYGWIQRPFHQRKTTCCGALKSTFRELHVDGVEIPDFTPDEDPQMSYLRKFIHAKEELKNEKDFKTLTYKLFYEIEERLHILIDKSNLNKYPFKLYMLGGVIINTQDGNYFDVLKNEIYK